MIAVSFWSAGNIHHFVRLAPIVSSTSAFLRNSCEVAVELSPETPSASGWFSGKLLFPFIVVTTGIPAASANAVVVTPFGVPDCDNYVKKFMACVDGKVTPDQKAALMEQFAANQTKWRALSTMREGAVALSLACRAANQKSKEELAVEYGCEF